jgi:hypothetical protein
MKLFFISYLLVPVAFIFMMKNYNSTNWIWLGILIASIFLGVAPFVAGGYLVTTLFFNKKSAVANSSVTYKPDGSYTVYAPNDSKSAPSAGKIAFRIVGGIIGGLAIAFGLLIVGILIWISTLPPSTYNGGGSKTM